MRPYNSSLPATHRVPPPPSPAAVVTLFNTISQHQKSALAAAASEHSKSEDARAAAEAERMRPSATSHSYLDLLHQSQGVTRAGGAMVAAEALSGSGKGGSSKWAVLSEGFHVSKAARLEQAGEEEDDTADILASDGEGEDEI